MKIGHLVWAFPDGDLPPRDPHSPELKNAATQGHESLIVMNAGPNPVTPLLHVYFPGRDPWLITLPDIPAHRVICYRTDEPLGPEQRRIPPGHYGLLLECSGPVVAQFGRMDIRQPNLSYYTVMGFPAQ